jgi:hypothetical protein
MKWSIVVCLVAAVIFQIDGQVINRNLTKGVGAVYTMTNGLKMNQVVVFQVDRNGRLAWTRAVDTNGIGSNSRNDDPLFSQGAMAVFSNYLFVVNAGSDSLSMFHINPLNATELTLLSVESTYGSYPISVAVNSAYACVLTGGTITGIRCFTYDLAGLHLVPSFDRNLTSFVSQPIPPTRSAGTFSEILFSPDDLSLIVSVKGFSATRPGYLLFFQLSNAGSLLASQPSRQIPDGAIQLFSMTPVGRTGLLITDPAAQGVFTMNFSSLTGAISNRHFTPIDPSKVDALCWSTYSARTGSYYVVGSQPAAVVELNIDLSNVQRPVQIVQFYSIRRSIGALDTTIISLPDADYLYVVGPRAEVIKSYRLDGVGKAVALGVIAARQGEIASKTNIAGLAAFVQNSS